MDAYILYFVVFGIPAVTGLAFAFSLISFLRAKKQQTEYPGLLDEKHYSRLRSWTIIIGIIFGIIVLVWGSLAILITISIAHM